MGWDIDFKCFARATKAIAPNFSSRRIRKIYSGNIFITDEIKKLIDEKIKIIQNKKS